MGTVPSIGLHTSGNRRAFALAAAVAIAAVQQQVQVDSDSDWNIAALVPAVVAAADIAALEHYVAVAVDIAVVIGVVDPGLMAPAASQRAHPSHSNVHESDELLDCSDQRGTCSRPPVVEPCCAQLDSVAHHYAAPFAVPSDACTRDNTRYTRVLDSEESSLMLVA